MCLLIYKLIDRCNQALIAEIAPKKVQRLRKTQTT